MDSTEESPNLEYYEYCQVVGNEIVVGEEDSISSSRVSETITPLDTDSLNRKEGNEQMNGAWSHGDVLCLIEFFEENREAFRLSPTHKPLWGKLAEMLGRTRTQCAEKFYSLKNSYVRNWEKNENGERVLWPYFPQFDALFRGSSELPPVVDTELSEPVKLWPDAQISQLLSLYEQNLENFETQSNKDVWEDIARKLGRTLIECSSKFRNMKHIYLLSLKRMKKGHAITWPYFDAMHCILGKKGMDSKKEVKFPDDSKSMITANKISRVHRLVHGTDSTAGSSIEPYWSHEDTISLISFYGDTKEAFERGKSGILWPILGKMLGREPEECAKKFRNIKQTYLVNLQKVTAGEQVKWHYFNEFHRVFQRETSSAASKEVITGRSSLPQKRWTHNEILQILSFYEKNKGVRKITHEALTEFATTLGRDAIECARKFQLLKTTYSANLKRMRRGEVVKWPYFDRYHKLLEGKHTSKWTHEESLHLLSFCEEIIEDIKVLNSKKHWRALASSLGRDEESCAVKFESMKRTYLNNLERKQAGGAVSWPYFDRFHNLFEGKQIKHGENRCAAGVTEHPLDPNLKHSITGESFEMDYVESTSDKNRAQDHDVIDQIGDKEVEDKDECDVEKRIRILMETGVFHDEEEDHPRQIAP